MDAVGLYEIYERSLGINVNLWWGIVCSRRIVMFGFGYRAYRRRGDTLFRYAHELCTIEVDISQIP